MKSISVEIQWVCSDYETIYIIHDFNTFYVILSRKILFWKEKETNRKDSRFIFQENQKYMLRLTLLAYVFIILLNLFSPTDRFL